MENQNAPAADPLAQFFDKKKDDAAGVGPVMRLLHDVAEVGGVAPLAFLKDEKGHPDVALTAALSQPEDDKRSKPMLRAHLINGERIVALTSSGWTALGQPNKREMKPTPQRIAHQLAPMKISKHLQARLKPYWQHGVQVVVDVTAAGINTWQSQVTAMAWGVINSGTQSDQDGGVGQLTRSEGLPRPDALIYEEWERGAPETAWPAWDEKFPGWEEAMKGNFTQFLHLLEVETAEKRTAALLAKVQRLNKVVELRAATSIIWAIDDPGVAQRIAAAVRSENKEGTGPRHIYADLSLLTTGVNGGAVPAGFPQWWGAGK